MVFLAGGPDKRDPSFRVSLLGLVPFVEAPIPKASCTHTADGQNPAFPIIRNIP